MKKKLRPNTLVRLTKSAKIAFAQAKIKQKYIDDLPLIFLGEIKNMPEHGIFVGHKSGKVYSGYHVFDFEEIPIDET